MTRVLAAIAVAALVVLAGCGASTVNDGPNAGADPNTDGTTTDDGFDRVTVPSDLVAPGASQLGIPNPRLLVQTHLQELSKATYETDLTYTKLDTGGEGTIHYTLTKGEGGFANESRTVRNGTETVQRAYRTPESAYAQRVGPNGTTYEYGNGPVKPVLQTYRQPSQPGPSVMVLYFQLSSNMQPTGFDTRNGHKVVRYESTGVNESEFERYKPLLGVPNGSLQDMSFQVYVSANGVIHDAEATLVMESEDGETRETNLDYSVSGINQTTLSAPAWTSDVAQLNGSVEADGKLIVVENNGEATLANHSIGVGGNVSAQADVNRSLAPGERTYFYATGEGEDIELHVSAERPDLPSDACTLTERGGVRVYVGNENVSISLGMFDRGDEENETARLPVASAD